MTIATLCCNYFKQIMFFGWGLLYLHMVHLFWAAVKAGKSVANCTSDNDIRTVL